MKKIYQFFLNLFRNKKLDKNISDIIDNATNTPEQFIKNLLDKKHYIQYDGDFYNKMYYIIDAKPYFEMSTNITFKKVIWCRYENFWEVLRDTFLLKNEEIELLVKNMLEKHLKCEIEKVDLSFLDVVSDYNLINNIKI